MATTQTDDNEAESEEEYIPDLDNDIDERILNYLPLRGEIVRAYEIADAIDSTPNYTRSKCNDLWKDDMIEKAKSGRIIGHPMPPNGDDLAVLESSRAKSLEIVDEYGTDGQYQQARTIDAIEDLRKFIKKNIAIGEGNDLDTKKVHFGPLTEE